MPDDTNPLPGEPPPPQPSPAVPPPPGIAPGKSPMPRPVAESGLGSRPVEIELTPRPAPRSAAAPKKAEAAKPPENKDSFREVVETVVFVVVLVLLLKTFLAEAFVIPTGSMATTLLGYHREVTCPKCGYTYPVNASKEADPQEPNQQPVISCTCPNCEFTHSLRGPLGGGAP
jgi:Signal peptidase, peptidase S26